MPANQPDLSKAPMGGTVADGGATFRIWAPRANNVWISGDFNGWQQQNDGYRLNPIGGGHWAGFFSGLAEGTQYLFYIDGKGTRGFKRDPRARDLTFQPRFPGSNCVLRKPQIFPWHNTGYRTPPYNDLIIYQLHVGTYSPAAGYSESTFLDVILRLPYLAALGVTAIEPLPIQEFPTMFSLGYNNTDFFSPENDYAVADEARLQQYFQSVNGLLNQSNQPPYPSLDALRGADNQLRAMVDLCHIFGLAVIFDVVYNHAGGGFDENSMWFLDRMPYGNPNDSLYFTDQGWAGGQVFAYWNDDVKQFLIDNAAFLHQEFRIDGIRYDEVSVMDRFGGWQTCQNMTDTLHSMKPGAIQIAEYWPVNPAVLNPTSIGGAGFDATWHDGPRDRIRAALGQAAGGTSSHVELGAVAASMNSGLQNRWRAVQFVENHDIVYNGRQPRIARLADGSNSRSWYARSRSRVAMGLVVTCPGIPLIFMGQEFLEDKQWNDNPNPANLIYWAGLEGGDKNMGDFLRFTRDLLAFRRHQPALRGEGFNVIHVHDDNRVLALQRWVEGAGRDVIAVFNLRESTWYNYQIGFPGLGQWLEVFNSDVYDNWVNPIVAGNGTGVDANGGPAHGLNDSAYITIPANGFVIFARDHGD
jgi:1,4-alpha-glucan branching enzyme